MAIIRRNSHKQKQTSILYLLTNITIMYRFHQLELLLMKDCTKLLGVKHLPFFTWGGQQNWETQDKLVVLIIRKTENNIRSKFLSFHISMIDNKNYEWPSWYHFLKCKYDCVSCHLRIFCGILIWIQFAHQLSKNHKDTPLPPPSDFSSFSCQQTACTNLLNLKNKIN